MQLPPSHSHTRPRTNERDSTTAHAPSTHDEPRAHGARQTAHTAPVHVRKHPQSRMGAHPRAVPRATPPSGPSAAAAQLAPTSSRARAARPTPRVVVYASCTLLGRAQDSVPLRRQALRRLVRPLLLARAAPLGSPRLSTTHARPRCARAAASSSSPVRPPLLGRLRRAAPSPLAAAVALSIRTRRRSLAACPCPCRRRRRPCRWGRRRRSPSTGRSSRRRGPPPPSSSPPPPAAPS